MEKYLEMRKEAVAQMAALCENPVEDTPRGMLEAREYIMRHGNRSDNSKAEMILVQWMWSWCEIWAHSSEQK